MKKSLVALAVLFVASVGFAVAAEKIESGLAKGTGVPAFNVKDVTGPNKDGDELCYRCRYGARSPEGRSAIFISKPTRSASTRSSAATLVTPSTMVSAP